jgi:predicted  nucleic acid-binding Zn-ribbon protein
MSIVVSAEDVRAFERLKIISQLAPLKERIKSFERKYGSDLEALEKRQKHLSEDFERWDDFIEWKAYSESLKDLESKLKKIENATDFRVAQ